MDTKRIDYTFLWIIENYSFCAHENGERLDSPEFIADDLEGTAWYLSLYPKGNSKNYKDYVSLFLRRSKVDNGPEKYSINYELSIIGADEKKCQFHEFPYTFEKDIGNGWREFSKITQLFSRKDYFLPGDTLRVQCKLWRETDTRLVKHITARTRVVIEDISFLHVIEGFSALEQNQRKSIQIRRASKNGFALTCILYYFVDLDCKGRIMMEITRSDATQILCKCKVSLVDKSGAPIGCGEADNRYDASRKDIGIIPLTLTRQAIFLKKDEYLPDDKLSLKCECIFTCGVKFANIEKIIHETPCGTSNEITEPDEDLFNGKAKLCVKACNSALDDLKALYADQLLTDVELKTKTKSFSAHKNILCARSSVFKAMLTNDMKERNTNCIIMDDLEDDTVELLLLFLYSDCIENLQWESAAKLYYAAEKYDIKKLQLICSSFLVDNLTASKASEVLLLADMHNDHDLKKNVEDYIFKHDDEVFVSEEWRNLIKINSVLVSETMCRKYMIK